MSKAKRKREQQQKEEDRAKKATSKETRMKNPGGGGKYASKQRRIANGDQPKFAASPDVVEERPYWKTMFDDPEPVIEDGTPDWQRARLETGDKASRFHPPREAQQQQVEDGLFQTPAYFIQNDAVISLKVGFGESVRVRPVNPNEFGVTATSFVAKKTGEAANPYKVWSHQPDTIPTWEIRRATGVSSTDARGKDKSDVVITEIVAKEREVKGMLAEWCETYGTSKPASQEPLPKAQIVSRFDY